MRFKSSALLLTYCYKMVHSSTRLLGRSGRHRVLVSLTQWYLLLFLLNDIYSFFFWNTNDIYSSFIYSSQTYKFLKITKKIKDKRTLVIYIIKWMFWKFLYKLCQKSECSKKLINMHETIGCIPRTSFSIQHGTIFKDTEINWHQKNNINQIFKLFKFVSLSLHCFALDLLKKDRTSLVRCCFYPCNRLRYE